MSVLTFQVAHFKEYIPQAFPGGHSMILDAEVLLIDTKTSKPLPFGTLGVHKVRTLQPLYALCFVTQLFFLFSLLAFLSPHKPSSPLPSESSLSRRQGVPFCFRLYLLQWCESHGEVMLFQPILCLRNDFALHCAE